MFMSFVCASFPFAFEGEMWDLIVLNPDYCFSIYYGHVGAVSKPNHTIYGQA